MDAIIKAREAIEFSLRNVESIQYKMPASIEDSTEVRSVRQWRKILEEAAKALAEVEADDPPKSFDRAEDLPDQFGLGPKGEFVYLGWLYAAITDENTNKSRWVRVRRLPEERGAEMRKWSVLAKRPHGRVTETNIWETSERRARKAARKLIPDAVGISVEESK